MTGGAWWTVKRVFFSDYCLSLIWIQSDPGFWEENMSVCKTLLDSANRPQQAHLTLPKQQPPHTLPSWLQSVMHFISYWCCFQPRTVKLNVSSASVSAFRSDRGRWSLRSPLPLPIMEWRKVWVLKALRASATFSSSAASPSGHKRYYTSAPW